MGKRKYGHLVTKLGTQPGKPRLDCPRCQQGECVRHNVRAKIAG